VFFVKLELNRENHAVSDNFYWSGAKGGSCAELNQLPLVTLGANAVRSEDKGLSLLSVYVTNSTGTVALMIRLKVVRAGSGERVLPAFYEDNYFSLLPSERRAVSVKFPNASLSGEQPGLEIEGWNIGSRKIAVH
jgi:hypothetical protein